jgi:hypothetical protein
MSWEDLESIAQPAEIDQSVLDVNILMARAFESEAGKKVLAHLRQFYLEQPCWEPGADSSFGQWREGQNSVIRDIEARIRKAKHK